MLENYTQLHTIHVNIIINTLKEIEMIVAMSVVTRGHVKTAENS